MKTRKIFLIFIGISSTVLGSIGIVVPLLPTTPFLLLATFCFVRSSPKLHNWLLNHKVLGKFIKNYVEHRAITMWAKITTIAVLWATLLVSIYSLQMLHATIFLLIVGVAVSTHLLMLKTISLGS